MPDLIEVPNRDPVIIQGNLLMPTGDGVPDYVDTTAMSAVATINTPCEDREGDVILPSGVLLDQYRMNPVVLWEHGMDGISKPIAKSEDPSGMLAVSVSDEEITAKSFFTHLERESSQVFHLIAAGIVRATSVRAIPVKSQIRRMESGERGNLLEEWHLIEWSWGALGVNPEAVAKTLETGKIDGSWISEPLLKSLKRVAPEPSNFFKGITLPGEKPVDANPKPDEEKNKMDDPENHNPEDDTKKMDDPDDVTPVEHPEDVDKMDGEMMEEDDPTIPMGAKVLESIHRDMGTLRSVIDAAVAPLEQPEVKQAVTELVEVLAGGMESVEGAYSRAYADRKPLAKMDEAEQKEAEEVTHKSLGIWINSSGNSNRLAGLRSRLKAIVGNKHMKPQQKDKIIAEVFRSLQTIERQATACQPVNYQKQVAELENQVKELSEIVDNLLPA